MRAPDQIDKEHPETDLMTQAIIRGAAGYRVAVPLMEAWDALPRSVKVAICMEFADLRPVPPRDESLRELVEALREIAETDPPSEIWNGPYGIRAIRMRARAALAKIAQEDATYTPRQAD